MSPDRPTPDLLLDTARTLDNLLTVLLLEADAAAIQAAKRVQELRVATWALRELLALDAVTVEAKDSEE